jgi:hypothetical protein
MFGPEVSLPSPLVEGSGRWGIDEPFRLVVDLSGLLAQR